MENRDEKGRLLPGVERGPMPPEQKEALRAALKKKWASGTRKAIPPEARARMAASIRATYATGKVKLPDRRGQPNPPGRSAKGVDHWAAKFWVVISPDKQVIAGVNLAEIVRRHAHLFNPEDLVLDRSKGKNHCNAWKGLQSLFLIRKKKDGTKFVNEFWKGWSAAENADMIKNVPQDHLVMLKPKIGQ